MTSRNLITAVTLLAGLLLSVRVSAQEQQTLQPRYKLFVIDTFGGPNSDTNGGGPVINNRGTVVGIADTSSPCPYHEGLISRPFKFQDGVMTDLGLLPGGCFSLPNAINSHGTIIVGSGDNGLIDPLTGNPEIRADVRKGGQIIDLGTFGAGNSLAADVNDRGQVVGVAQNAIPDSFKFQDVIQFALAPTQCHAFLWQDGVMHDLGTLAGPDSAVGGINERGQIAGISFTNSIVNPTTGFPTLDPFLWTNGKMLDLGTLGGTFGTAGRPNNRGQVVGWSDLEGDSQAHPYLWDGRKMKDLGVLGGTFGTANWINDAGEVVGGSTTPGNEAFHAVRWHHGLIHDLGTLAGDSCSSAFAINAKGQAIGQSFKCSGEDKTRAVLWNRDGSIIDLNGFVPANVELELVDPHFINDRGEIVVAGIQPDGNVRAVVLIPCDRNAEDCQGAAESENATAPSAGLGTSAHASHTTLAPEDLRQLQNRFRQRLHLPSALSRNQAQGETQ
jgi:probable HAF family extracellular repeat protein